MENKEGKEHTNAVKRKKANLTGYIVRRDCLLKQVIEGEIREGKMRQKT